MNNSDPKQNKKIYRGAAIAIAVMMFIYILVAIGDLIIKGYSDLPSFPFILGAILCGAMIGLYIQESRKLK
ncbi:hypothetical protein HYW54_01080 [Candidatus Gottesmanbacteria bacterium]|nr:hypothetical protein [Candidatus Gottesmanbacteria bacterium]